MAIITVIGRIGKGGAQIKKFGEKDVIVFSLAEDAYIKGEQKTIWYEIYMNNARNLQKLTEKLKQGRMILVNGTFRVGTWKTNTGTIQIQQSINVESVTFIRSGSKTQNNEFEEAKIEDPGIQVFSKQDEMPF